MPPSRLHEDRIVPLPDEASGDAAVDRAARIISSGGLIVYPTETVYGIGADARNVKAIGRIPLVKGRGERKPILVLVGSREAVTEWTSEVSGNARALMNAFWPGPLTLVFRARDDVSELLTAGTGTVGLRCSPDAFCRELIRRSGKAITSTSANRTGEPTRATVEEIAGQLGDGIDLYVDAGPLGGRLPSTVVDVSGPAPSLVREGAIAGSELFPFMQAR
jgi:L-threonylcarbamoyladenylate synthase